MNGAAESASGTYPDRIPQDESHPAQASQHNGLPNPDTALPSVKSEPTSATLDRIPASDDFDTKSISFDGAGDFPTSKKVANLKNNGLNSRASSSERSSPANSVKPTSNKKGGSGTTKKGTAKKPPNKKRKGNDVDADSMDRGRSNTPASVTSKGPGKKQSSVSIAGSPAPEAKNKKKKQKPAKKPVDEDGDESFEDENEIFCICRRPDNHTWMIGCDGDCDDWFHGKCVNIDPRDADLIEKYICECPIHHPPKHGILMRIYPGPNCNERGKGVTTWKRKCRLPECRKPARVVPKDPSKYCSDEHGREFMRRHTKQLKRDTNRNEYKSLGSMGGVLTVGDLKAAITGVESVQEFRTLGNQIMPPPPELAKEESPNGEVKTETKSEDCQKLGLDITANGVEYSPQETAQLGKLREKRDALVHRKEMLAARSAFIELVRQRAKSVVAKLKQNDPKGGWKDICGFDSRLAWADEEFDEWRLSDAGKQALAEGTAEAMAASYSVKTDADGDTAMDGEEQDDMEFVTRGICVKKRCERHKQWVKVQQQDITFEEETANRDLKKNEQEACAVAERAVLRQWAEQENSSFK